MANSTNVKHLNGKLIDHFTFKVNAEEKVEECEIIEDFCRLVVTTIGVATLRHEEAVASSCFFIYWNFD